MPLKQECADMISASLALAAYGVEHTDDWLFLFTQPDSPLCTIIDGESLKEATDLAHLEPGDIRFSGKYAHLLALASGHIASTYCLPLAP